MLFPALASRRLHPAFADITKRAQPACLRGATADHHVVIRKIITSFPERSENL
jgi:hypothetical protein